jgi:hypothetical protein
MKILSTFVLVTLFVLPLCVQDCPDLSGEYWCVMDEGKPEPWLDVLTIQQSIEADSPNVTNFRSSYRSIPGGEETLSADITGIEDGWGWIIKCTADRVVSVRDDFSAMSELYLDKTDRLVRTYNDNIQQTCSRKSLK